MRRPVLLAAVAAAVCSLLLVACGGTPDLGRPATVTAADATGDTADACPEPNAGGVQDERLLADDVLVTAVVQCLRTREAVAGDGEWSFSVRQRATGPQVDELVAALRMPSEPPVRGFCTMELLFPVSVDVQTTSGPMRAGTPKDGCGRTRKEVVDAWQALRWTEVARPRGEQELPMTGSSGPAL